MDTMLHVSMAINSEDEFIENTVENYNALLMFATSEKKDDFKLWFEENCSKKIEVSKISDDENERILAMKEMQQNRCFSNSQDVALLFDEYDYYEGFMYCIKKKEIEFFGAKVIEEQKWIYRHGFNCVKDSNIVCDFTAHNNDFEGKFYSGVKIPKEFIRERINKRPGNPTLNGVSDNESMLNCFFIKEGKLKTGLSTEDNKEREH